MQRPHIILHTPTLCSSPQSSWTEAPEKSVPPRWLSEFPAMNQRPQGDNSCLETEISDRPPCRLVPRSAIR